jgi:uncharacterized protein
MRIIALEEHFQDPGVAAATPPTGGVDRHSRAGIDPSATLSYTPSVAQLQDIGEGRIADMDRHHIDMQVLSSLTTQTLPPGVAAGVARQCNDRLAAAVSTHPTRFAGFAALPTTVPETAADELARAVWELGFVGALIMGRTDGEFLDAPRFDPVLQRAADLNVPIYLHPGVPPRQIVEQNYGGLDPVVTARFATSAWGWHNETAVHFIHLVLSGVLDRYPGLQFILGHWGEMIPFYLDRLDEALPRAVTKLERTFGDYMRHNAYITPSGLFTQANLDYCAEVIGTDRIMFSVDYPFVGNEKAAPFLAEAHLSETQRENIAHRTAERLFNL